MLEVDHPQNPLLDDIDVAVDMTELDDGLFGTEMPLLAQREQLADHLLRRMEIPLVHNLVNQSIHG